MRNDVFRRDEIWFAALDPNHSSELYSLYEIRKEDGKRVNHTASYDKQYLEGRYGADPYLREMMDWEELTWSPGSRRTRQFRSDRRWN